MDILSKLLGGLLHACYLFCGDYLAALTVFTLLTKVIQLPISIWVQKNSIKLVRIMPQVNDIKCRCYGDRELINNETFELYKKEKYNPFLSLIPLVVQVVLLLGVIDVVKSPAYAGLSGGDMLSAGIDFTAVPVETGGAYLLFPLAAAVSALILCITQNISQVLQAEQGKLNKYGMMALSVALSLYLGFFVSSGVAAYWILSNVFAVVQMYILNAAINPKKYIDYKALEESREKLKALGSFGSPISKEQKKQEKADYKRFFSIANKHIVFYSEQSGFYKYFRTLIQWLTAHSNLTIHYVTSDPNDIIFREAQENSRIKPYYIGENRLITLFLKMDARIVVMTMPDLENFHIKRSIVCKDTEYIYMDHGLSSINLLARKGAVDHFDTVFCAGQHIIDEIRAREVLYSLPPKTLVEYGYGYMDELIDMYKLYCQKNGSEPDKTILIAPSHQKDNILDSCLDTVVSGLSKTGYRVIIRPHPQYIRRNPDKWNSIKARYANSQTVVTESDFSSDESVYKAAIVVTDWSNIGYEYSFSTLRPVLYVDTPMKIINPDYEEIGITPIDICIRNMIGISVSGKDADEVYSAAEKLLSPEYFPREHIIKARESALFNIGRSTETAGRYILSRLKKN